MEKSTRPYLTWDKKRSNQLIAHAKSFTLTMAASTTLKDYINQFKHPEATSKTASHNRWTTLIKTNDAAKAAHERMIDLIHKQKDIQKSQAQGKLHREREENYKRKEKRNTPSKTTKSKEISAEDDNPVIGLFKKAFLRQPKQVGIGEIEQTKDKLIIRDITILFSLLLIVIYSI
jgi:hypothetical protein